MGLQRMRHDTRGRHDTHDHPDTRGRKSTHGHHDTRGRKSTHDHHDTRGRTHMDGRRDICGRSMRRVSSAGKSRRHRCGQSFLTLLSVALMVLCFAPVAHAADGAPMVYFSLIWVLPFAALLLSIALVPLIAPHFWHAHFGKVAAFWSAMFLVPLVIIHGGDIASHYVAHTFLLEYIPFVVLLLTLYTVSGGIRLTGNVIGTPAVNTAFLTFGTLIASWIGTTGAAMLLIRPLLRANEGRAHKVHTVTFFIFLVANIGGSLTPLGDPPLFLGFLNGIGFFWTFHAMLAPMLFVSVLLLALFWGVDHYFYRRENPNPSPSSPPQQDERFGINGGINILLLVLVVVAVFLSGTVDLGVFTVLGIEISVVGMARDLTLLGIALASLAITPKQVRQENHFTWFPIKEIGKLFAAIFITIVPAIAMLRGGDFDIATLAPEVAVESLYFWGTGLLSGFLDNAPTYLVFFNMAGGDPVELMGPKEGILQAISCGAVFMGALTYIGNAPNFMVRAIAVERGVAMPHFAGYMAVSALILIPVFLIVGAIWFS